MTIIYLSPAITDRVSTKADAATSR